VKLQFCGKASQSNNIFLWRSASDANVDQNNQERDMRHERCLAFAFLWNN